MAQKNKEQSKISSQTKKPAVIHKTRMEEGGKGRSNKRLNKHCTKHPQKKVHFRKAFTGKRYCQRNQ
jgi:hypothetical protein